MADDRANPLLDGERTAEEIAARENVFTLAGLREIIKEHVGVKEVLLAVVGIAGIGVAVFYRAVLRDLWNKFLLWCTGLGLFASIPFIVAGFITQCIGSGMVAVEIGAGAVFQGMYGLIPGSGVAIVTLWLGVYPGCIVAFKFGKTFLKPLVTKYLEEFEMLRVMNKIVETEGWKFAFLIRLSPVIPVEPMNFACSVTSMRTSHYALSCIGSLPVIAFETFMAAQGANAVQNGGIDAGERRQLPYLIAFNVVLFALMGVMAWRFKSKYDGYVAEAADLDHREKHLMKSSSTLGSFKRSSTRLSSIQSAGNQRGGWPGGPSVAP